MALRVLSIFGTRPEAVKMAPVVKMLSQTPGIDSVVCVTAQHRQMLDQVLNVFGITPDYDLDLMRPNQTLAELTANIFTELDPVMREVRPDWILVVGDTTTVMTASVLAFYQRVRVGHVEAGLRTLDRWQPYPEEINRRIASVVADLHFAPTQHNRQNLLRENVAPEIIIVTGNPAIDALQSIVNLPAPVVVTDLLQRLKIGPGGRQLIAVTAHRRENFGQPMENICRGLRALAETYADRVELVYPVHLNQNVQEPVYRLLSGVPNITLLPPLDYFPMIHLMKHARLVLTDSGGIQEEATCLGVPALVMRDVTERPEGVEAGVLKLVGANTERIVSEARTLLENENAYRRMACAANPFGDGHASERIVAALLQHSTAGG